MHDQSIFSSFANWVKKKTIARYAIIYYVVRIHPIGRRPFVLLRYAKCNNSLIRKHVKLDKEGFLVKSMDGSSAVLSARNASTIRND